VFGSGEIHDVEAAAMQDESRLRVVVALLLNGFTDIVHRPDSNN
jgi:hypothetical protein